MCAPYARRSERRPAPAGRIRGPGRKPGCLSLTSPLAADEDVDVPPASPPNAKDSGYDTRRHILRRGACRIDDDIGFRFQRWGCRFGLCSHHLPPACVAVASACLVAFGKLAIVRAQVHMQDPPHSCARLAELSGLFYGPDSINDQDSISRRPAGCLPDRADEPVGSLEFSGHPFPLKLAAV